MIYKTNILPLTFGILTICGFWLPNSFNTPYKKWLYNIFSFSMFFLIWSFTLSHLVEVFISANNFEDLTGSCFMLLSMLNVCCKMTNILYFRSNIDGLLKILKSDHCSAKNIAELEILQTYHNKARFVTLCYASLTETTCMLITARTFFGCVNRILPFNAWIPYKITSGLSYWITFFHQTIAHVGAANLQIANETLICGLMIQACAQLELLKYRLKNIRSSDVVINTNDILQSKSIHETYSKGALVECVEHHRCIMEFSERLNYTFAMILFVQFAISSLVLCSSVYLLSKMNLLSVQFMSLSLYLSCMLYQIFLFCWYGNEVLLQSTDIGNAIYHMDWTSLPASEKKNVLRMMLLISKPIKFTSSFLVTLSIDSYCKILKTSYSVFNLLQRTSTSQY